MLTVRERDALAHLHVRKLYLRLFDVDWDARKDEALLRAPVSLESVARLEASGFEVVPVVYIRERVLHASAAAVAGLAARIWSAASERGVFRELQVDCDWTDSSRVAFFTLLGSLHERAAPTRTALSATIRLHQVKYLERTGVPPVQRGMLMFYNMGSLDADPGTHAIFDPNAAQKYLGRIGEYPLPLDVALPVWSWVVHQRAQHAIGVLKDLNPSELEHVPWLKAVGEGRFEATETTFLRGTLVREGDILEAEITGPRDSQSAAEMVASHLAPDAARTVSLFDLSERNLLRHDEASLESLFATIR